MVFSRRKDDRKKIADRVVGCVSWGGGKRKEGRCVGRHFEKRKKKLKALFYSLDSSLVRYNDIPETFDANRACYGITFSIIGRSLFKMSFVSSLSSSWAFFSSIVVGRWRILRVFGSDKEKTWLHLICVNRFFNIPFPFCSPSPPLSLLPFSDESSLGI